MKDDPYSETLVGRARAFREAWLGLIDVIARELRVYKALDRLTKIINDRHKNGRG